MTTKKPTIASTNKRLDQLEKAMMEIATEVGKLKGIVKGHMVSPDAHNPGTLRREK